jgi:UrcA family protein
MFAKTLFSAGLLGLALAASQPAQAAEKLVTFHDLDLSTKDGNKVLDARLRKAAKDVCELSRPDLSSSEWESARQCFAKSLADARKAKSSAVQATVLASAKSKSDLAVR